MFRYYRETINFPGGGRKDYYGKTKEELEDKILKAKMQMRAGVNLSVDPQFGEFALMWYSSYKKPNIQQATREYYQNVLNNHILPYIGNIPIRNITAMHIIAVMNELEGKSKELNRKTLQTLRNIFDSAVDNNLIVKSPVPLTLKPGGKAGEKKASISREHEAVLLNALKDTRAFPFVLIALNTGMRRGEICGLKWDCVDFDEGIIRVRRNLVFNSASSTLNEYLKTDCSIRDLPITPALEAELRKLKAESQSMFVIAKADGKAMTRSSFRSMWECVNRRKTDPTKKARYGSVERCIDFEVTPHLLRHTFLTRCFENGLDMKEVQYLAGHKTPELTMRIYLHYQAEERKKTTFSKVRKMSFA